jgi:hypothetical protein
MLKASRDYDDALLGVWAACIACSGNAPGMLRDCPLRTTNGLVVGLILSR